MFSVKSVAKLGPQIITTPRGGEEGIPDQWDRSRNRRENALQNRLTTASATADLRAFGMSKVFSFAVLVRPLLNMLGKTSA